MWISGPQELTDLTRGRADKGTPLFAERWTDCSPRVGGPNGTAPQRYPWPAFPTWCAGQGYSPDFARPLGPPESAAATPTGRGAGEVTRRFASGTAVTVALNGSTCVIEWADGFRTVCEAGPRAAARA